METTGARTENAEASLEQSSRCPECGWPGVGVMPAGEQVIKEGGSYLPVGHLTYYHNPSVLCSVCQDMESAVRSRPWFIKAHAEYLDQVRAKTRLLRGE